MAEYLIAKIMGEYWVMRCDTEMDVRTTPVYVSFARCDSFSDAIAVAKRMNQK